MSSKVAELDISIVIPSFNRGGTVRENSAKWLAMRPRAKEIVLVDDHSDAESEAILRRLAADHSCFKYLRLSENGGQAVSRSAGFTAATGKYIVSLDDDSWFIDEDGLQRVWDRMEAMPSCGILAFNLFSPGLDIEPAANSVYCVADHLTCGAAYRTEVLRQTGYHLACLRFVGEEADLSLKVRGAGYEVLRDFNVRGFHDYDPAKRSQEALDRVCQMSVRNDLARTIVYFPVVLIPWLLLWKGFSHLRHGAAKQSLTPTLAGVVGFVRLLPELFLVRNPVSFAAAMRYLRLRRSPEAIVG